MAAQIWYENDGDLSVLEGKKVASSVTVPRATPMR